MLKHIARLRIGLVFLLGILLFCSGAFAMGDRRDINRGNNGRYDRGDNRGDNGGDRHYYRDGRWYKHDSSGNEVAVRDIYVGARVESLPPQHTTIVIQGEPYHYDNSHYYKELPDRSFVVVQPPRR